MIVGEHQLDAFADALTRYAVLRTPSQPAPDLASLRTAVASARRAYQTCQYAVVAAELPALLIALQEAVANAHNDERLQQLHVLFADAYHVAASVLLKLDDHGLASPAADRSMRAAEHSEEPLALGASARILVHTMMDGGHLQRATPLASDLAARRDPASGNASPADVSVYGALLLRGAVAAAYDEDRAATLALADEAEQAARRPEPTATTTGPRSGRPTSCCTGSASPPRSATGVTDQPGGRVLYVIVCGAGPAPDVGRLVQQAQERGWQVHIIATPAALPFIDDPALEAQTGNPVRSQYRMPGDTAQRSLPNADAIIVAPATYNTINKWTLGVSDTYALGGRHACPSVAVWGGGGTSSGSSVVSWRPLGDGWLV